MTKTETKLIQFYLQEKSLYAGEIDGLRGDNTDTAIREFLQQNNTSLDSDWLSWPSGRKSIACLQLLCEEHVIEVGAIDGFYGPQTEAAVGQLKLIKKQGFVPRGFGDIEPIRANPHGFPLENETDLTQYYGLPCEIKLARVSCPWRLRLDWDLNKTTQTITIHEKLADSLSLVLDSVFLHYGIDGIKQFGLDRYGGSYVCRKKRNSKEAWSTHARGISIDWFPSKNKLSWRSDRASLAQPELDAWWEIWEQEGWLSLGRTEDRDWMHIQAAKR